MADPPAAGAPVPDEACSPCRGTGTVISNLGGEPKTVTCPWCQGGGRRLADHDAQARFREAEPQR